MRRAAPGQRKNYQDRIDGVDLATDHGNRTGRIGDVMIVVYERSSMSVKRQMFEVIVAGLLAVAVMLPLNAYAQGLGAVPGIIVACLYYFSRYPWGSQNPEWINERIDAFYDTYFPV